MAKTPKADAGAKQKFDVMSPLHHDGDAYEIGETVELTRAQFELLKASGVVKGAWAADQT